jgi:hypothetical protein
MLGINLIGGADIEVITSMTKAQIIGYGLFLVGEKAGTTIITDSLETILLKSNGGNLISLD